MGLFTCDGCGRVVKTRNSMPDGWLKFWLYTMYGSLSKTPEVHVCSPKCAGKAGAAAAEQLMIDIGVEPGPEIDGRTLKALWDKGGQKGKDAVLAHLANIFEKGKSA